MGLKYKEVDGIEGCFVPFLDIDSILFNVGKQVSVSQKELTKWKSRIKKNVCLTKKEDILIEIEVLEGKNNGKRLEELEKLELRLFHYPFLYYRKIRSQTGEQGKELISIACDLETLKEVIISDLSIKEQVWVENYVVLHYLKPINVKILYHYNSEFVDYYTIGSWLSLDVELRQHITPKSIEFDLYEIKREGERVSYTESLTSCTLFIDTEIDKLDEIKVFKDGKEIKQGMRYIEKWVGKQLIFDRGKSVSIYDLLKEGSKE